MMHERGLNVDHTTIWRWVQKYAPEINKRIRPHLKMSGTSYRIDVTKISDTLILIFSYKTLHEINLNGIKHLLSK